MKSIFVTILICVSSFAFGKNTVIEKDFLNKGKLEIITKSKKKIKVKQPKTMLAFEYYYTVDWLYAETPFTHKLEALV